MTQSDVTTGHQATGIPRSPPMRGHQQDLIGHVTAVCGKTSVEIFDRGNHEKSILWSRPSGVINRWSCRCDKVCQRCSELLKYTRKTNKQVSLCSFSGDSQPLERGHVTPGRCHATCVNVFGQITTSMLLLMAENIDCSELW